MLQYVNRETARVNLDARERPSRNKIFNKVSREVIADAVKAENKNIDGSIIYGPNDEVFEDPHDADIVLRPVRSPAPELVERPMSNLDKAQLSNRELTRKFPTSATKMESIGSFVIKDPDYANLLE